MYQLPPAHDVHMVDQSQRHHRVLLDQQNCKPCVADTSNDFPNQLRDDGGEALGWFIHDQAVWIRHQRSPDCKHLLFAARQRTRPLVSPLPEAREQIVNLKNIPSVPCHIAARHQQILFNA